MSLLSHPARSLVAVTLLAALAACGSSADKATPSGSSDEPTAKAAASESKIPEDLCTVFTAEDFAAVVGAPVTVKTEPTGSCGFTQDDPRAVSGSVSAIADDAGTGGFEAARSGASGAMDSPEVIDVDGVGTKAFLAFGTVFGGESIQVSGGTTDGKVIAILSVQQGQGLDQPALEELGRKLLALADDKLH